MNSLKKYIMFRFIEVIPKALLIPVLTWWWFENWYVIAALILMCTYISMSIKNMVDDMVLGAKSIDPNKGNQTEVPLTLSGGNFLKLSNVESIDIPSDSVGIADDLVQALDNDRYKISLPKTLLYISISLCTSIATSYTVGTMTGMLGGIVCFIVLCTYTGFLTLKSGLLLRKAMDEYRENFDTMILPYTSNVGAISFNDTMFTITDRNLVD